MESSEGFWTFPVVVASLRLVVIVCLVALNIIALCLILVRKTAKAKNYELTQLCMATVFITNIFYLWMGWFNFSLVVYIHSLSESSSTSVQSSSDNIVQVFRRSVNDTHEFLNDIFTPSINIPNIINDNSDNSIRNAFEGSWSIAFPRDVAPPDVKGTIWQRRSTPQTVEDSFDIAEFLTKTAPLQDFVTSTSAYIISFVTIMRFWTVRSKVHLPRLTPCRLMLYSWIMFLLPLLVTALARLIHSHKVIFTAHTPVRSSPPYTIFNILCDVFLDTNYLKLIWVEFWAFVIMLCIFSLATLGSKVAKDLKKSSKNKKATSSKSCDQTKEMASSSISRVIGDLILLAVTVWAWPAKLTLTCILYQIYGQHYTNIISWCSNLLLATSSCFLPVCYLLIATCGRKDLSRIVDNDKHSHKQNSPCTEIKNGKMAVVKSENEIKAEESQTLRNAQNRNCLYYEKLVLISNEIKESLFKLKSTADCLSRRSDAKLLINAENTVSEV